MLQILVLKHYKVLIILLTTNIIFTSFRGSSNIHNWTENIQVTHINPYKNTSIAVEKGFYKDYEYIKKQLFENLDDLVSLYNIFLVNVFEPRFSFLSFAFGFYLFMENIKSYFIFRDYVQNEIL